MGGGDVVAAGSQVQYPARARRTQSLLEGWKGYHGREAKMLHTRDGDAVAAGGWLAGSRVQAKLQAQDRDAIATGELEVIIAKGRSSDMYRDAASDQRGL